MTKPVSKMWRDGRSGRVGQIAGGLVLDELARELGEPIRHRKGTTFVSAKRLFVCRSRAKADDLTKNRAHWCNLSPAQIRKVADEARKQRRELFFLFITATPNEVHYWLVPASVTTRALRRLTPKRTDKAYMLQILQRDDRFMLEEEDITEFHRVLHLDMATRTSLIASPQKTQRPKDVPAESPPIEDDLKSSYAVDVRLQRVFDYGDELAVMLPRAVTEAADISAGSLVQATAAGGDILLRPVDVVPRLNVDDQRFVDELYRRRRPVFEALAE